MITIDSPIEARLEAIRQRAEDLVGRAADLGLVVTIHLEPLKPLAMRNYEPMVDVREFRQ